MFGGIFKWRSSCKMISTALALSETVSLLLTTPQCTIKLFRGRVEQSYFLISVLFQRGAESPQLITKALYCHRCHSVSMTKTITPKAIQSSNLLFESKHPPKPAVGPVQPPPNPPRNDEGYLCMGMRLVKQNGALNFQRRGAELPDGAVELLGHEPGRSHGVEEVLPRDFTRA